MDTALKNCPKCGHAVVADISVCTYCGELVSKEEPPGQAAPSPGTGSSVQLQSGASFVEMERGVESNQEIAAQAEDSLPGDDDTSEQAERQIEKMSEAE
jgi:hypothetical protein